MMDERKLPREDLQQVHVPIQPRPITAVSAGRFSYADTEIIQGELLISLIRSSCRFRSLSVSREGDTCWVQMIQSLPLPRS